MLLLGCGAGKQTTSILTKATKVEVYRIDGGDAHREPKPIAPGEPTIGGFALLSRGADQGPEFAKRLDEILSDQKTYSREFAKCFSPGVAFRIYKDAEPVDLIICFLCQNFYLGPPSDVQVRETASFHGTPAVTQLVRLAKEAFPDDKAIQALAE
jgi:hypothetical protein